MRANLYRMGPLATGIAAIGLLLAATQLLGPGQLDQLTLWTAESVLALSLSLVWGQGGIFSLGQTAFYGLAAYAYGVVAVNLAGGVFLPAALGAAAGVALLAAAVVGYFMLYSRVGPVNVAIITLALTLVLYALINNTASPNYHIGLARIGGFNGMTGIPLVRTGGPASLPMSRAEAFLFVGVLGVVVFVGVAYLLRTPFGRVAAAVRSNERRAELFGYDVRWQRWLLFVVGAAIAGLAGGLFVVWGSFVTPTVFALQPAVLVLIWILVGGRDQVLGAPLGVFGVEAVTSWLGGSQGQYSPIYLGLVLIAIVLLLPGGLLSVFGLGARLRNQGRIATQAVVAPTVQQLPIAHQSHAELSVAELRKRFAGLAAVDGVSVDFPRQGIRCVIGPNGAGKSTLFALLTGTERPTSGRVLLNGRDITGLPPYQRARAGIGIKLQTASVFADLPVHENLWLAAYGATHDRGAAALEATRISGILGLDDQAEVPAGQLAHGLQQWLEIGMVLAMRPSVMLLDEPTAGMSVEETERVAALIKRFAEASAVVVIEHDMAFIRRLDAPVTVLHLGRELAHGRIRELEADDRVLSVYLGRHHQEWGHAQA